MTMIKHRLQIILGFVLIVTALIFGITHKQVPQQELGAIPQTILQKIEGKSPFESATIKGKEIAKVQKGVKKVRSKYDIEIDSINPIEGGVEIFARVWDKNGQIGFGKDGSVDIERFVIINPPILVPDATGEVVRTYTNSKEVKVTRKLREDAEEAVLQVIEGAVDRKTQKHDSSNIITGKIGNTTTVIFPEASPGSTSFDGFVAYVTGTGSTWATAHDAATGNDAVSDTSTSAPVNAREFSSARYQIQRVMTLFDSSSIGSGQQVDSATLEIYVTSKVDGDTGSLNIVTVTPASNTAIVAGDYDQFGTTLQATEILLSAITTSAYNTFTINTTGQGNIDVTGITKFGVREENHDIDNVEPANDTDNFIEMIMADTAGTTQDPKLTVEHTALPTASVKIPDFPTPF